MGTFTASSTGKLITAITLLHDVAIISNGNKSIVLAIYIYNPTAAGDSHANQQLFKQITSEVITAHF